MRSERIEVAAIPYGFARCAPHFLKVFRVRPGLANARELFRRATRIFEQLDGVDTTVDTIPSVVARQATRSRTMARSSSAGTTVRGIISAARSRAKRLSEMTECGRQTTPSRASSCWKWRTSVAVGTTIRGSGPPVAQRGFEFPKNKCGLTAAGRASDKFHDRSVAKKRRNHRILYGSVIFRICPDVSDSEEVGDGFHRFVEPELAALAILPPFALLPVKRWCGNGMYF